METTRNQYSPRFYIFTAILGGLSTIAFSLLVLNSPSGIGRSLTLGMTAWTASLPIWALWKWRRFFFSASRGQENRTVGQMTPLIKAELAAKTIADSLQSRYLPTKDLMYPPEAGVVPSSKHPVRLFLVINIQIDSSQLSVPILWELTVPLMKYIPTAARLSEFWSVWIQIFVRNPDQQFDKVLRLECLVSEIGHLRATQKSDLLSPEMWQEGKFTCYWYWDTKTLPSE